MPSPILVAVDPLREDPEPLAFASLLSELTGRRLVAVGAYPRTTLTRRVDVAAYRRSLRDLAMKGLESARERMPEGTETLVVPGDRPPRVRLEAAEELDAATLVLGSARHGPTGRVVTGSVSDHLPHGANCPVAGAVALARRAGASLVAITVVHPIGWGTMAVPMATTIAREHEETRRAAEAALRHALDGLEPRCPLIVVPKGSARALEDLVGAPGRLRAAATRP
jgi:nucleotide-binding universal stress UspA family protein